MGNRGIRNGVIVFLTAGLLAVSGGCATDKAVKRKKADAYQDMGAAAVRKGNLPIAVKNYEEAAALDPENATIQHELAMAYRDLGDYGKAEQHFQKAVTLKPDFPEAWNNLATLYLLTKQWDKAISSTQKALASLTYSTPQYAYNNQGLAYYNKGQYQKAVDTFLEALKIFPSYTVCLTNLGLAYEALRDYKKAIESYTMAIQFDPGDPNPHFFLGRLYYRLKSPKKAKQSLERALELDPKGTFADGARAILRHIP